MELLNLDCLSLVFKLLALDDYLSIRRVNSCCLRVFDKNLHLICDILDIHPCSKMEEFITANAHKLKYWRIVPSFNKGQRMSFSRWNWSPPLTNREYQSFVRTAAELIKLSRTVSRSHTQMMKFSHAFHCLCCISLLK